MDRIVICLVINCFCRAFSWRLFLYCSLWLNLLSFSLVVIALLFVLLLSLLTVINYVLTITCLPSACIDSHSVARCTSIMTSMPRFDYWNQDHVNNCCTVAPTSCLIFTRSKNANSHDSIVPHGIHSAVWINLDRNLWPCRLTSRQCMI